MIGFGYKVDMMLKKGMKKMMIKVDIVEVLEK